MFDYTKKTDDIIINVNHPFEVMKKRESALIIFNGLIGNCYIMAEIIDWLLVPNGHNIFNHILNQKWCRFKIKNLIKESKKELTNAIKSCLSDNPSERDYQNTVADAYYDEMSDVINKTINSIEMYIGKYKIKTDVSVLSEFLFIDMLYQWIEGSFNESIEFMNKAYPGIDYELCCKETKMEKAHKLWSNALDLYLDTLKGADLDLNQCHSAIDGICIINNIMKDNNISEQIKRDNNASSSKNMTSFVNALKDLGIKQENAVELVNKEEFKEAANMLKDKFNVIIQ